LDLLSVLADQSTEDDRLPDHKAKVDLHG